MADSGSERVLKALFRALFVALPPSVEVVRNASVPARIPAGGWVCVRDGDPGQPDVLLSPPSYHYEHVAEVDVVVDVAESGPREALFDLLKQAVGAALAQDRTLEGLCDYVLASAPAPVEIPIEGASSLKAATIDVVLTYALSDPLA